MELYDAIFRQPHDVWNLIGGLLLLVVGLIGMIMTRRPLMQVIARRREAGASEEELRAMRQRLGRVTRVIAVVDLVILPLLGYFLFGPILREMFGG
jgi:hypothetical protein